MSKTMYNKMVDSPEKREIALSAFPLVLGVGANAFLLYRVWFYHIAMSNYDIDPIKNNTYFASEKYVFTEVYFYFFPINWWLIVNTF